MATKRPDGRVEPGQRISSAFSARAWNRAQDAADVVLGARTGAEAGESVALEKAVNIVLIRNDSARPVPMFGVLAIESVTSNPEGGEMTGTDLASQRAKEFSRRPVLTGRIPVAADKSFAIALEPILQNKIGRAAVSGATPCRVEIVDGSHNFATVRDGDVTQLRSANCGPVQLLWKPSGAGLMKWALGVR